jgi:hypothetical protein
MTDEPWGFILFGRFIPLPKTPMLMAKLGPPPFDVTLPGAQVRHVVVRPSCTCGEHGPCPIHTTEPA